jgi:hypothetical protein
MAAGDGAAEPCRNRLKPARFAKPLSELSFACQMSVAAPDFALRVPVMVHLCRVVDRGRGE